MVRSTTKKEVSMNQVTCPHCGYKFDIEESLKATQAEEIAKAVAKAKEDFQKEFSKLAQENKTILQEKEQNEKELKEQLANLEKNHKAKQEKDMEILTQKLRDEFAGDAIKQAKELKAKFEKDKEVEMQLMKDEIEEKMKNFPN